MKYLLLLVLLASIYICMANSQACLKLNQRCASLAGPSCCSGLFCSCRSFPSCLCRSSSG